MKYYGTPKAAIEHLPEFINRSASAKKIKLCTSDVVLREIESTYKAGVSYLLFNDERFSALLKKIDNFPPVLTYKGNVDLMNRKIVGIVGSRNCSISGKQITTKLANDFLAAKIVVCSGLARGIDAAAHKASLPNTIGVIAGGIGNIYPPENHQLYSEIAESGVIISELPITTSPLARHFPQRNRIIAGLSHAIVIIEASLSSGSLITANFGIDNNREIFACPGFPLDPRCQGSNKLIKEGAQLLESSNDVIEYISHIHNEAMEETSNVKYAPIYKNVDESLINESSRMVVLSMLSNMPISLEEIAKETDLPFAIIITILLELELEGKITSSGTRYILNY
ncbi:MAG: DNA-processing protein DprA [Rickettsiaceae bacterium]|nr:DNA-processing protein DprA [Rickettsiaceae bacterium]